jgi:shikimate kinase
MNSLHKSPLSLLLALLALLTLLLPSHAFLTPHKLSSPPHKLSPLQAGGFEWEDPTSEYSDPGIENPYKNPALLSSPDSTELKIDAARLLSPRLRGCNIYLIGMMGCGKSAVGDAIARRMTTYNYLDMDRIIEKAAGMSIPQIFEEEGESSFREVESQVLDSLHAYVRCVVSTGGGVVLRNNNWAKLQTGVVVYLKADPEIIMKRIEGTDRPLLQTENPMDKLKQLMEERRLKYEQADVHVDIGEMDVAGVAEAVVRALHDFIDENPPAYKVAKAKAQADGLDWVN